MHVAEIWRYPVKSMGGEQILSADINAFGIAGDRVIQVVNARGRIVTSRTHPALLGHHGSLSAQGTALVDNRPWHAPSVLEDVRKIVGLGAKLVHDESLERFDVLPLLVATDGSIAAFGRDRRRLRPNIVIGGVDGLEERTWPGSQLRIGDVIISVQDLRGRCIMTTFDPDNLHHDPNVLRDIVKRFGGKLALNCSLVKGGRIKVDQEVEGETR